MKISTVFAKSPISDFCQGSEHAYAFKSDLFLITLMGLLHRKFLLIIWKVVYLSYFHQLCTNSISK